MNPAVRRVLLGRGDDGLMHVPEEPRMFSGEAACAPLFSESPISVEVIHCEIDTPVTCLACVAKHLNKLWTVLAGTIIRVDYGEDETKDKTQVERHGAVRNPRR